MSFTFSAGCVGKLVIRIFNNQGNHKTKMQKMQTMQILEMADYAKKYNRIK